MMSALSGCGLKARAAGLFLAVTAMIGTSSLLVGCVTSPAAQQKLDDITAQLEDLKTAPPTPERDAKAKELELEAQAVVRQDHQDQTLWWAQLAGAVVGGGSLAGVLGSRVGPSRSRKAVEEMREELDEMADSLTEAREMAESVFDAFVAGLDERAPVADSEEV